MKTAYFSAKAVDDLDSICAYIQRDNPEAAQRVRTAVLEAAGQLEAQPELGQSLRQPKPKHQGIRMLPVREYRNYMLIYRIEEERILVLRILHAAQDWTRFFGNRKP